MGPALSSIFAVVLSPLLRPEARLDRLRHVSAWQRSSVGRRSFGAKATKPIGGDRSSHRIEAHAALILTTCEERPQLYLRELLREHGVETSISGLARFFVRHKHQP